MLDPCNLGGLSSSNGNVGDLLQLIEQSEKSQEERETENDFFLDFINSDPKGPQQPAASLFVSYQAIHQLQAQQN